LRKEFKVYFDGLENGLKEADMDRVVGLTQEFGQLVNLAGQFDGTMSNSLRTIGAMVSQVGSMAKTLSTVGSGMSKAGGVAGIVGSVLSISAGNSEAIEASYSKRALKEKEANDYQIKQLDAQTQILEYQLQLIEDIYGTKRVEAYAAAVSNSAKQVNAGISELPSGIYALQTDNKSINQYIDKFNKDFGNLESLEAAINNARKESNKLGNKIGRFFLGGWVKDWKVELRFLEDLKNKVLNTDQIVFQWQSITDI